MTTSHRLDNDDDPINVEECAAGVDWEGGRRLAGDSATGATATQRYGGPQIAPRGRPIPSRYGGQALSGRIWTVADDFRACSDADGGALTPTAPMDATP